MRFAPALQRRWAEEYWGQRTDNLTTQEIRDLHQLGPRHEARPNGVPPVGVTHEHGLIPLLVSPNYYPVHYDARSLRYKAALLDFEEAPWPHDPTKTWGDARRLAIRFFFHVYDLFVDDTINRNNFVGAKSCKHDERYKHAKNLFAASIIHMLAYGIHMSRNQRRHLSVTGKQEQYKHVHNMFVRPLAMFFTMEMNPSQELDYMTLMTVVVGKAQEHYIAKAKFFGIWSDGVILSYINRPSCDPLCFTQEHKDVCKGIPYGFARLAALIFKDFDWSNKSECYWTVEERRALFDPLDPIYCYPQYPPISTRFGEYGAFRRP